ncbi:UNVERIFIED_CONTAM: hypothetical protein O1L42_33035, partial [Pseudomonas aeruginosa]
MISTPHTDTKLPRASRVNFNTAIGIHSNSILARCCTGATAFDSKIRFSLRTVSYTHLTLPTIA